MILWISLSLTCKAQVIDTKVSLHAAYFTGIFHGKPQVQENNFLYPSLYSNMNNIHGFKLKIMVNPQRNISLGIGTSSLYAFGWDYSDSAVYQGAEINMRSLAPVLQYHTALSNHGFFNRGKMYAEISPLAGYSDLDLMDPLFEIYDTLGRIIPPKESHDLFFGIAATLGLEWAITQAVGFTLSYSYQYNWINAALYADNHFVFSRIHAGISLKLIKDKHFIYR